jgi:hypothetical protein
MNHITSLHSRWKEANGDELKGTRGVEVAKDAVNNHALSVSVLFTRGLVSKTMLPHHKSRCAILRQEDSRRGPRRRNENPCTFCCK